MSFYFDDFDDDDDDPLTQGTQSQNKLGDEPEFLCVNCGGRESYEDAVGILCCTNCFTQSQDMVYEKETTLEYDQIMAVAARTRDGRLVNSKLNKQRKAEGAYSNMRVKQPLIELDKSKPLPGLRVCIRGFTAVLQGGVKSVSKIMRLNAGEQEALTETVKHIWLSYLRAWSDGAELYGAQYPDMRFALRDTFLTIKHKAVLFRVLSHKVTQTIKEELEQQQAQQEAKAQVQQEASGEAMDEAQQNNDHDDSAAPMGSNELPSNHKRGSRKRERVYKNPTSLLKESSAHVALGREAAALYLKPSMELAASIIWFSVARIGITTGQLVCWIANGTLPLLNAFQQLLTIDDQNALKSLQIFFTMWSPPLTGRIERQAALLAVACGMKESEEIPQLRVLDGGPTTTERVQKVVDRIRFVSVDSVPLMLGQLVADLRLGQRVLDIALALTGSKPSNKASLWLPAPLQRTNPRKVSTPEHALAVIVVACKMCPGWESWSYVRIPPKRKATTSDKSAEQRFVPWNEKQFSLLRDDNISDYLDFLEEVILVKNEKDRGAIPQFSALLEKSCKKHGSSDFTNNVEEELEREYNDEGNVAHTVKSDVEVVLPSVSNEKHKELLHRHPKNYLPYLTYPDKQNHTHKLTGQSTLTPEPFHSYYTRLVEYVAYKVRVAPHRIHALVTYIDEEIVELCKKRKFRDPEMVLERKKFREKEMREDFATRRKNPGWAKLLLEETEKEVLEQGLENDPNNTEKKRRLEQLRIRVAARAEEIGEYHDMPLNDTGASLSGEEIEGLSAEI